MSQKGHMQFLRIKEFTMSQCFLKGDEAILKIGCTGGLTWVKSLPGTLTVGSLLTVGSILMTPSPFHPVLVFPKILGIGYSCSVCPKIADWQP